jgi:hypothetical protein
LLLVDGKAYSIKEDMITETFCQIFNANHRSKIGIT